MDKFCRLDVLVMDYRTKQFEIIEKDLKNTPYFEDTRETAIKILEVVDANIYIYIYIHIF